MKTSKKLGKNSLRLKISIWSAVLDFFRIFSKFQKKNMKKATKLWKTLPTFIYFNFFIGFWFMIFDNIFLKKFEQNSFST